VQRLFSGAPKEYDTLLSRLTLRNDSTWRQAVLDVSNLDANALVLDVATGTGLMAFDFVNKLDDSSLVIGVDLCERA
jgi:ubiquinone/menaquinone biosynthesis C-methylase UbiE